jgi:outer membrane biosynthesis protein TonB
MYPRMIGSAENIASLQPSRLEIKRLVWAFALSLAIHAFVWGGYEGGKALGIWDRLRMPAWIKALTQLTKPPRQQLKPLVAESEPPLMFVEVNPAVSTAEAPKKAPYYSDKNSRAANSDADADTDAPKISGSQEHVAKTDDVKRNDPNRLQPYRPPEPEEASKPKSAMTMGDLALGKPDTTTRQDNGQADGQRPRTVQEALTRQQLSKIPGQKMRQEGGVKRRMDIEALDARATPFGAYDAALIEAVSKRWYDLLDSRNYSGEGSGKVVLKFHLKQDGTITDMEVVESTVDTILSYLCQQAVRDPAPFERWPGDMRRMIGADYREIKFAFFYN